MRGGVAYIYIYISLSLSLSHSFFISMHFIYIYIHTPQYIVIYIHTVIVHYGRGWGAYCSVNIIVIGRLSGAA